MKENEIRQEHGSSKETFIAACKNMFSIIEKEREKKTPDYNYMAALGALGLAFSHMAELVKAPIAITIALTVSNKEGANNFVLLGGDKKLEVENNDSLLAVIQKEILNDYNVGG